MDESSAQFLRTAHEYALAYSGGETPALLAKARVGDEPAKTELMRGYLEEAALAGLRFAAPGQSDPDAMQDGIIILERLIEHGEGDDLTRGLEEMAFEQAHYPLNGMTLMRDPVPPDTIELELLDGAVDVTHVKDMGRLGEFLKSLNARGSRAVALANREAETFPHDHVSSGHLLLGLLDEREGIATGVLAARISDQDVRRELLSLDPASTKAPSSPLPFTPRCRDSFLRSLDESRALGHRHVGTEHLLLGIVSQETGAAVEILRRSHVELASIRKEILSRLSSK